MQFLCPEKRMVPTGSRKSTNEIHEELEAVAVPTAYGDRNDIPLLVRREYGSKFCDTVKGLGRFMKFGASGRSLSTTSKFWRIADEGRDILCLASLPPNQGSTRVSFVRKINWASLLKKFRQWIKHNLALFVWINCVAISVGVLSLVKNGMLNGALPRKSQRDTWVEVNNQVINALFTLMCLYQHPERFHHLFLLCRWNSEDILRLRKAYCKNGTEKPDEWKHMLVVVILLHVNCFAQYAFFGLSIGYPKSRQPAIAADLFLYVAIAAVVIAKVYNIRSSLGKEYNTETEKELQVRLP